ncbi:hypothetical protein [Brevundimonas aurifodinae]|uniref:MarR family transcriptional regulator n=1 Tax=Brevundimonas aurifodinae TaxID=1508312 RepID=A0ABV1NJS0_9CAUL
MSSAMLNDHVIEDETLAESAARYVSDAFGQALHLAKVAPQGLPHFVMDRYGVWRGDIAGQPAAFMILRDALGTVAALEKHREIVRVALRTRLVILIAATLPVSARRRLVEARIGFLVPGAQLYVPEALLNLQETGEGLKPSFSDTLSPTAQVLVIAALLNQPVNDTSLTQLADRYQVSVMSMSRALDELEAHDAAEPHRVGRQRRLNLRQEKRDLWTWAEPRLVSPVRKVRLVRGDLPRDDVPLAGESALAFYTMLAGPRVETRAAPAAVWRRMARHLELEPAWLHDERAIEVQTWSYDPLVLSRTGVVDPVSLYMSMRDATDERVSQAAGQLMEGFEW